MEQYVLYIHSNTNTLCCLRATVWSQTSNPCQISYQLSVSLLLWWGWDVFSCVSCWNTAFTMNWHAGIQYSLNCSMLEYSIHWTVACWNIVFTMNCGMLEYGIHYELWHAGIQYSLWTGVLEYSIYWTGMLEYSIHYELWHAGIQYSLWIGMLEYSIHYELAC